MVTATSCQSVQNNKNNEKNKTNKISVVTTIFPQYDFVRQIAGDNVELTMLLSPGAESHSFEPTPQEIMKIQNCDMFIYVGGESDQWINKILGSMDTSKMKIISLIDVVDVVEEEVVEGMEDEHDDTEIGNGKENQEEVEYDEHVWTSPQNTVRIVKEISKELSEVDKDNALVYEKNTKDYVEKLTKLDQEFKAVVAQSSHKTILFGDRFPFRYLAEAYGLDYYAAFPGCSTETEPSAATIAFLIDKVKSKKLPIIFYIEFSNEKVADTIAESTGAKKLLLHSAHNISKSDFENNVTYIDMMRQNVENLREALR